MPNIEFAQNYKKIEDKCDKSKIKKLTEDKLSNYVEII